MVYIECIFYLPGPLQPIVKTRNLYSKKKGAGAGAEMGVAAVNNDWNLFACFSGREKADGGPALVLRHRNSGQRAELDGPRETSRQIPCGRQARSGQGARRERTTRTVYCETVFYYLAPTSYKMRYFFNNGRRFVLEENTHTISIYCIHIRYDFNVKYIHKSSTTGDVLCKAEQGRVEGGETNIVLGVFGPKDNALYVSRKHISLSVSPPI